jgi:hypothetical protein
MKVRNPEPDVLLVAERRCNECLFSTAAIVPDARREEILEQCNRDHTAFVCHKYSLAGQYGICRGFFDGNHSLVVRLAKMLGRVRYVPLP